MPYIAASQADTPAIIVVTISQEFSDDTQSKIAATINHP
jgi:hypothetical protein